jgi:hypothetical protein
VGGGEIQVEPVGRGPDLLDDCGGHGLGERSIVVNSGAWASLARRSMTSGKAFAIPAVGSDPGSHSTRD